MAGSYSSTISRVARDGDERVAHAAADDVDLAVHRADERVVASERHRRAALPRVRDGIVDVIDGEVPRRPCAVDGHLFRSFHGGGAADQIHLAADLGDDRRSALHRKRRERLPRVGDRVVLPGVVDRFPSAPAAREDEAAEHVDLALVLDHRLVMDRAGHRLLLGPAVGRGVVLEDRATRLAAPEAAENMDLAAGGYPVQLLVGFRKRRELGPTALRERGGGQQQDDGTRRKDSQRTAQRHTFLLRERQRRGGACHGCPGWSTDVPGAFSTLAAANAAGNRACIIRPPSDRYAARWVNFDPRCDVHSGLGARRAPRDAGNQPRALPGYQGRCPWLVISARAQARRLHGFTRRSYVSSGFPRARAGAFRRVAAVSSCSGSARCGANGGTDYQRRHHRRRERCAGRRAARRHAHVA